MNYVKILKEPSTVVLVILFVMITTFLLYKNIVRKPKLSKAKKVVGKILNSKKLKNIAVQLPVQLPVGPNGGESSRPGKPVPSRMQLSNSPKFTTEITRRLTSKLPGVKPTLLPMDPIQTDTMLPSFGNGEESQIPSFYKIQTTFPKLTPTKMKYVNLY
ncbi:hypothetical protein BST79_gp315 [Only Syngen Nebraska virus 5]|uniref:hypothetical protein n=1 Tax=Only Syngen Nebraska virus 5 TaxID=1917232 RepID=UPI0009015BFC|nr:hypothetical protein BST79_gp315 [Only Syngen Nebraska virus 5]APC25828.1 hypothetical protein [Only Syngen Nebraska virus 5]